MKRFLLTVFLMIVGVGSVSSQQFRSIVTGDVCDECGLPIIGATVLLTDANTNAMCGTLTNVDGNFYIISSFFSMQTFITVNCVGYKTVSLACPTYNGCTSVHIQMEPDIE